MHNMQGAISMCVHGLLQPEMRVSAKLSNGQTLCVTDQLATTDDAFARQGTYATHLNTVSGAFEHLHTQGLSLSSADLKCSKLTIIQDNMSM